MKISESEVSFEGTLVVNKVGPMYVVRFFIDGDTTGPFSMGNFASVPEQVLKEFKLQ